jgi:tetratricopeptide (TPR) repeat protein
MKTLNRRICLGLILLNLAIFAGVRNYGFAALDDSLYVTDNYNVAGGLSLESIRWAFTTDRAGYWVPLMWLSHILDVQVFGMNAGAHHVVNVLFHISNTLLLFGLLRRLTGGLWQSAVVAALFAVHPLRVESVAWVAERKDVLSTLFWILTVWAYTTYVRQGSSRRYLLVLLCFAAALMSKPSVVTLPAVLLLLDYWPLGRANPWLRLAWEKVPMIVMAAVSSAFTVAFHAARQGLSDLGALPFTTRLANAAVSYVAYMWDTLWPVGLAPFYPYAPLPAWQVGGSFLVLAGLSAFALAKARSHPYLIVGWLWFIGTLVPTIGFVQAGLQSRADRFTYVPLVGLFIAAAWGIPALMDRCLGPWRYRRAALCTAAVISIFALTIAARAQAAYWQDSLTLWQHALDTTKRNFIAHNIVGLALAERGRLNEAVEHYRQALAIAPGFHQARNNLGTALARDGRIADAIPEFRAAIASGRANAEMHRNLGLALAMTGNGDDAMAQFNEALRIEPDDVASHTNLGDVFFREGKLEEAIVRYREALRIQPRFALAHNNLATALASLNRPDEAIVHYEAAIRLQPGLAEAHNGMGDILAIRGDYDRALFHFSEALRIRPDFASARANLENVLAVQRL